LHKFCIPTVSWRLRIWNPQTALATTQYATDMPNWLLPKALEENSLQKYCRPGKKQTVKLIYTLGQLPLLFRSPQRNEDSKNARNLMQKGLAQSSLAGLVHARKDPEKDAGNPQML
jgi:hypothetical protein